MQRTVLSFLITLTLIGCGQDYQEALKEAGPRTEVLFPPPADNGNGSGGSGGSGSTPQTVSGRPTQTVSVIPRVPMMIPNPIDLLWIVDNSSTRVYSDLALGLLSFSHKYLTPSAPGAPAGANSLLSKNLKIAVIPTDLYLAGTTACALRDDLNNIGNSWVLAATGMRVETPCAPSPAALTPFQNPNGNYGAKGIISASNFPPARRNAAAWVDPSGIAWIYGGESAGSPNYSFGDLWKWDGANWTWMDGTKGIYPLPTGASGMGGLWDGTGTTWLWNETRSSAPTTMGIIAPGPGVKSKASAWVDSSNKVWLFGGFGWDTDKTYLPEGYVFDKFWHWNQEVGSSNNTWSSTPNLLTPSIGTREGFSYGVDKIRNQVWFYGGMRTGTGNPTYFNDLWKWDNVGLRWIEISSGSSSSAPIPREKAASWTDKAGSFYIFGGSAPSNDPTNRQFLSDFWIWPATGSNWVPLLNTNNTVPARHGASSWTSSDSNFWLFGGYNGIAYLSDLWMFQFQGTQSRWVSITPDNQVSPPARMDASSWVDLENNLWLFGGYTVNSGIQQYLNDLWRFTPYLDSRGIQRGRWKRIYATIGTPPYPSDYATLKSAPGYHGRTAKPSLSTLDPNPLTQATNQQALAENFLTNVRPGNTGSLPPSGFASLARFIWDNDVKPKCISGDATANCSFFRQNSKRILVIATDQYDFSQWSHIKQWNPFTMDNLEPLPLPSEPSGLSSLEKEFKATTLEKSLLDNFFLKLDNTGISTNLNTDPDYMILGIINSDHSDNTCGEFPSGTNYFSAPPGKVNLFCSYRRFINLVKSNSPPNSMARNSQAINIPAPNNATYLDDPLGAIIKNIPDMLTDFAQIKLLNTPTSPFTVKIEILNNGSTTIMPSNYYTVSGTTLTVNDRRFGTLVDLNARLQITYIQNTP